MSNAGEEKTDSKTDFASDRNQPSPTSVRLRIVWVSVLMAFGLYLTRNTLGEMVKSNSFLEDPVLVQSPSTRFSVELKEEIGRAHV